MPSPERPVESAFLLDQLIELTDALRARQVPVKPSHASYAASGSEERFDAIFDAIGLELAARRAGGESYAAIAIDLNRRGLRGRYGGRWYTSSVRALLQRARAKINPE